MKVQKQVSGFWQRIHGVDLYEAIIISTGFLLLFGIITIWNRLKVIEKIYSIDQRDWDAVKGISLQVDRFDKLLNKLEEVNIKHTITAEGHRIEIDNIKYRIETLERKIGQI